MANAFISPAAQDIANIKDSWATVERQLFGLGVRVFISLLESQPNIKRTFRQYRSKRHSELRINEDLQKLILYLMCGMKRVVKCLNDVDDHRALTKYLRRMAKKHSPTEIDFGRINASEVASVFCSAIKEISPTDKESWSKEVLREITPPQIRRRFYFIIRIYALVPKTKKNVMEHTSILANSNWQTRSEPLRSFTGRGVLDSSDKWLVGSHEEFGQGAAPGAIDFQGEQRRG